jgi:uncharacterized protein
MFLQNLYQNYLFKYPKWVLIVLSFFVVLMGIFATRLEIDASSETLLLEEDKDLEFTREIGKRFTAPDILVVTYSVENDLLSEENIKNIQNLSKKLENFDSIDSINSIVNVPLLQSPVRPIKELVSDVKTLIDEDIDKVLVKQEFLNSPIYKENLVSSDFKTTVLMLNLKRDEKYYKLLQNRDRFIALKKDKPLTGEQKQELQKAQAELKVYRDRAREENHNLIVNIRSILSDFEKANSVKLHLGGANMIADDMVEFVKYDLQTFGIVIVLLLIVVLYLLLKEFKWVFIPLFICTVSIIITSGFLGLFGWEITVISSNYISLQLIMNISLVVHLIIKYKELLQVNQNSTQEELVLQTLLQMSKPSFFVVITTIAGFSSLVLSGILPVINFGWMMSVGIVISLLCTFLLFPLVLLFFSKKEFLSQAKQDIPITAHIGNIAINYKNTILLITLAVVLFSISGATKLRVENSFIDYFKQDTGIYQGMELIDQKLGGTTPLDVVITFKENSDEVEKVQLEEESVEDELLDDFADEFEQNSEDKEQYWFTKSKLDTIEKVHRYLDSLEPIGKVLSLTTLMDIGKVLNDGEALDGLTLALINKELPQKYKEIVLLPYVDIEKNMARISTRIIDSMDGLERNKLINQLDTQLQTIIEPNLQEYQISNLLVIYNNMLQSLFDSQIKTMGVVILILFCMFLVLFKNLKIALIAITANTVPVSVIFGVMGWFDIPLDMMTITIAAISIGIAVDNTIHYIHRYRLEFVKTNDYIESVKNAHKSIGRAMFYTSTIIMIGFSILVLSNFIPTIFFGVLTMLAMFMAIVADLLLLPTLLIVFKGK